MDPLKEFKSATSQALLITDEDSYLKIVRQAEAMNALDAAHQYAEGARVMFTMQNALQEKVAEVVGHLLNADVTDASLIQSFVNCLHVTKQELQDAVDSFKSHAERQKISKSEEAFLTIIAAAHVTARKAWELFRPKEE